MISKKQFAVGKASGYVRYNQQSQNFNASSTTQTNEVVKKFGVPKMTKEAKEDEQQKSFA